MTQQFWTLVIKKQDGSVYWTEYFNDQASCDEWLQTEMTRPYWDSTWTATKTAEAPVTSNIPIP